MKRPNRFLTFDYQNPWLSTTWSSNPLGLYSALKDEGAIVESLWVENSRLLSAIGFGAASLLWPRASKQMKLIYSRRKVRRRLFGVRATEMVRKRLPILPAGTRLLTCSNAAVDLSRCGLPVWHYSDATLGAAAKYDEALRSMPAAMLRDLLAHESRLYRGLDRLLLFSHWARDSAIADHGIDPQRVHVVGHAPCIPDPQSHAKLPTDHPTVLFVCTDWLRKGGPLVLDAFRLLRKTIPDAELVIVGYLDPERVCGQPGVHYVGPLRKDDPIQLAQLIEHYRRADVFALASTYDPMPNVTLEANLCGTPVVATRVCAVAEQISDEVNGWLADRSAPDIAAKLKRAIYSADTLRASSRSYVSQIHSWAQVCRLIQAL